MWMIIRVLLPVVAWYSYFLKFSIVFQKSGWEWLIWLIFSPSYFHRGFFFLLSNRRKNLSANSNSFRLPCGTPWKIIPFISLSRFYHRYRGTGFGGKVWCFFPRPPFLSILIPSDNRFVLLKINQSSEEKDKNWKKSKRCIVQKNFLMFHLNDFKSWEFFFLKYTL